MENRRDSDEEKKDSVIEDLYSLWSGMLSKSLEYYSSAFSNMVRVSNKTYEASLYFFATLNGYGEWLKRKERKGKD